MSDREVLPQGVGRVGRVCIEADAHTTTPAGPSSAGLVEVGADGADQE